MTEERSRYANHILLVGFMGSGKSTVGRHLARLCDRLLVDTDTGVEHMVGREIPEIFSVEGEAAFRAYEHEYLLRLIGQRPSVVSCGGGIVTTPQCRELLPHLGCVVFLEVSVEEALARIGSSTTRPLLKGSDEMRDLLETRLPWYLEVADARVDTAGREPAQIAAEIDGMLRERGVL